jgi:hypothetical protein
MFEPGSLEIINRSVLFIRPLQPFSDWLAGFDPTDASGDVLQDSDVYLLPEYDTVQQMESWLKKNFDSVFMDQLNNWYIDEEMWPKNRTLKMFKEWFDYSFASMVKDTKTSQIEKD